jgi:hypothetical protein
MLWLDRKYANLVGMSLEQYKVTSDNPFAAVMRCPLCGDSKKKKTKKRGNFYEWSGSLLFHCHNCGATRSFSTFLGEQNPALFMQYKLELLRNRHRDVDPNEALFKSKVTFEKKIELVEFYFGTTLECSEQNDPVLNYVKKRMIPSRFFGSLYSCISIRDLVTQIPRYRELTYGDVPVLVIPFYTDNKTFSFICCRAISKAASFRYYVFEVDNVYPKLWGLEFVDWSIPLYITEGPIDAMMLPNALALGGSVGSRSIQYIKEHVQDRKQVCFVYDNELISNLQILQQVQNRINQGYSVVIYNERFTSKDLNDAIVSNEFTSNELLNYIKERTFDGLRAKLELARLRR